MSKKVKYVPANAAFEAWWESTLSSNPVMRFLDADYMKTVAREAWAAGHENARETD
jgi:hypothetical protein